MECIAVNLLEPGDEAIVGVNGVFGARMKDVMERCGATVRAKHQKLAELRTARTKAKADLKAKYPPPGLQPGGPETKPPDLLVVCWAERSAGSSAL